MNDDMSRCPIWSLQQGTVEPLGVNGCVGITNNSRCLSADDIGEGDPIQEIEGNLDDIVAPWLTS
jgi:hypothetical protein